MGNNCSCTDAADKEQEVRTDPVFSFFSYIFFRNNLKFQAKVSSNPQLQLPQPTSEATKASIMDNLSKMPPKQ